MQIQTTENPIGVPCGLVLESPVQQRNGETDALIAEIRRAAKKRRRALAWSMPMILVGMVLTVCVFSRIDIRLSLIIFAVTAGLVAARLSHEAAVWDRLARRAAEAGDIRAIGPLLSVLNARDSSSCNAMEEALIVLIPRVESLSQLSRNARAQLNQLLLCFEMPGLRGGHNAELARCALEMVARFRDCEALPAVRRLAEGFSATRPAASIRDLAGDILADLEDRAALLRPAEDKEDVRTVYLRPVASSGALRDASELLRPDTLPDQK